MSGVEGLLAGDGTFLACTFALVAVLELKSQGAGRRQRSSDCARIIAN